MVWVMIATLYILTQLGQLVTHLLCNDQQQLES